MANDGPRVCANLMLNCHPIGSHYAIGFGVGHWCRVALIMPSSASKAAKTMILRCTNLWHNWHQATPIELRFKVSCTTKRCMVARCKESVLPPRWALRRCWTQSCIVRAGTGGVAAGLVKPSTGGTEGLSLDFGL